MKETDFYKRRDKNMRDKFNDVAEDYEEFRFSYPDILYERIFDYCGEGMEALEIGIGTGKATKPFLQKGYHITAVEPGAKMLEIAERKYAGNPIQFINSTFENTLFTKKFDLIYAASSFQWVNDKDRVRMVYDLLSDYGTFVRFKTMNVILEKGKNNCKLRNIYLQYLPDYLPDDQERKHMKNEEYTNVGFTDIKRDVFYIDRLYKVDDYLKLIHTYTEYLFLPDDIRREFECKIASEIGGDHIVLTQKCTLFMARKEE